MTSPGGLRDPEDWFGFIEPRLLDGLQDWLSGQDAFLLSKPKFLHRSDQTPIAVAQLDEDGRASRTVIVRLLPSRDSSVEFRGIESARQESPAAFRRHLPEVYRMGELAGTGWAVHIHEISPVDGTQLNSLGDLLDDQLGEYAGRIVNAVVNGWTRTAPTTVERVSPADYLWESQDDNRAPDGSLRRFSQVTGLNLDDPASTVVVRGRGSLPNPLALMRGAIGADLPPVSLFSGLGHGDMVLDNVLVPVGGEVFADEFRLIRLRRFTAHAPIAADPATLLLSIAQRRLSELPPGSSERSNLAELTVAPWAFSASKATKDFRLVSARIHSAGHAWATEHRVSGDWPAHFLLILIDAALRRVGLLGQPGPEGWWYLEVAAVATRCLLDPAGYHLTPREILEVDERPKPVVRPGRYSPQQRLCFVRHLGDSWTFLHILLEIEDYETKRWAQGDEPDRIWKYLVHHNRLTELSAALRNVGRNDLADMLDGIVAPY